MPSVIYKQYFDIADDLLTVFALLERKQFVDNDSFLIKSNNSESTREFNLKADSQMHSWHFNLYSNLRREHLCKSSHWIFPLVIPKHTYGPRILIMRSSL